jgi:nitrogen fixation protein FixH
MKTGKLTGRHVLFGLTGFFGTIFLVNGVFLYSAIQTYTGVVSNEPYRKGIEYNRRIAAERAQAGLGWTHEIALRPEGKVIVDLKDRAKMAVRGVVVTARVGRPSTRSHDVEVALEPDAAGRYTASVGTFGPGNWLVKVDVRRADGSAPETQTQDESTIVYRAKERVWLKP